MNGIALLNRHRITISIIVLVVVSLVLGFWINNLIISKKQSARHLTPRDVYEVFQNAGYQLSNIVEQDEGNGTPLGNNGHNISLDLQTNNSTYEIRIIQYETWERAQKIAKSANNLDKRWNGYYAYSFSYGKVLVMLWPSDEEFGDELLSVLEANE